MKTFLDPLLFLIGVSLLQFCYGTPVAVHSSKHIGYQVWSIRPETEFQVKFLKELDQNEEYDFWSILRQHHFVDIMVPAKRLRLLAQELKQFGLHWTVKIPNVELFLEEQRTVNDMLRKDGNMSWTAFHTYNEIVTWLKSLPESYPGVAMLDVIGKSYEGRDIHVLKISKNDGNGKPAIFFDATFHAREWITPATLTWAINEILTKPEHDSLLSKADLYFVPIVNPDGYEYTHTTNRLWRKTRNLNNGSTCIGTDPNRNMPYQFGGSGSSSSPCSDVYHGGSPLSIPETKSVADFVVELQSRQHIHAYLSIHSAANMWLLPWNYEIGVYPEDFYTHLLPWGLASVQAIFAVHGHEYVTGQGAEVIYEAAGVSQDWAKSIGIKYSATLELRADYGFTPPPSEIIPTAEEMLAGLLVIESTIP